MEPFLGSGFCHILYRQFSFALLVVIKIKSFQDFYFQWGNLV